MFVMREETDASLPQIGQVLGGRDHTTVGYGCDKIAGELTSDPDLARAIDELRDQLYKPVRVR